MLDCIIEERNLVSIVVTITRNFLTFVSNEAEEETLKALLVNFKTDFNLRYCDEKLILIKRSANTSDINLFTSNRSYGNDSKFEIIFELYF